MSYQLFLPYRLSARQAWIVLVVVRARRSGASLRRQPGVTTARIKACQELPCRCANVVDPIVLQHHEVGLGSWSQKPPELDLFMSHVGLQTGGLYSVTALHHIFSKQGCWQSCCLQAHCSEGHAYVPF